MPSNQEFKKLLVKLGINTSDWQSALKSIRSSLDDLNRQELAKAAQRQKAADQQLAAVQAQAAAQKKAADEQAKAVQAHLEKLNMAKQAYSDIQSAITRLRAQIDLEVVGEDKVLKKRQDIVAQCEIEMDRLLRLRNPDEQQLAILQRITAERARQLEQIEKIQAAQIRRIPVYGPTQQQLGTATTAVKTEATEAALALRLRMTQQEAISTADVVQERQRIVALVDKEIADLEKGGIVNERDAAQIAQLLGLREQQVRLINQAQVAQERLTAQEARSAELEEKRRVSEIRSTTPIYGPTRQQLNAPAVSEATEATLALRLKMSQQVALTTAEEVAERQKIVALADKEIADLEKTGLTNERDISQLTRILALREAHVRAIQQEQTAQERLVSQEARRVELAAKQQAAEQSRTARQVVSPENQTLARLRSQLATTDAAKQSEVKAIQTQILAILDKQIAAIREKISLDRQDVVELGRLSSARASQARQMAGGGGGGGGTAGGLLGGALGGFGRGLAGPVFAGVLGAEAVGGMVRGWAEGLADLVKNIGQLEHLRDAFERLGAIKGADTTQFLKQLRDGTFNLVPDIDLLRVANASMESGLKVSTDQIVQMTHATVALALSQGQTATRAVNALDRAFLTGRFQMLGYVTGIQRAELQMQKLGGAVPQLVQREEQFNTMLDAMNRKLLMIGEPVLTVTDRLTILRNEYDRVRQSFAISLVKTEGFREFLGFLNDIVVSMRKSEEAGTGWGRSLGQAFYVVAEAGKLLVENWKAAVKILSTVGEAAGSVLRIFTSLSGQNVIGDEVVRRLTTFSGLMETVADGLVLLRAAIRIVEAEFDLLHNRAIELQNALKGIATLVVPPEMIVGFKLLTVIVDQLKKHWDDFKDDVMATADDLIPGLSLLRVALQHVLPDNSQAVKTFGEQLKEITKQTKAELDALHAAFVGGPPPTGVKQPVGKEQPPPPDQAYEIKMRKLQTQLKEALDKEDLENAKAFLQQEKDANEAAYAGLRETFSQYITYKKRLREADLQATLRENELDRKAKLSEISFEEKLATAELNKQLQEARGAGGESTEEQEANKQRIADLQAEVRLVSSTYEIRKQIINAQAAGTAGRATAAALQQQQQLDDELTKDHLAAQRTMAQAELQTQKESLDQQKQSLEDNFKEGLVTAADYVKQRTAQIEAERDFAIAEATAVYNNTEITEKSKADLYLATVKAFDQAEKEKTKLALEADDLREKQIEGTYQRMQRLLSGQEKLTESPIGRTIVGESEIAAVEKLIALNATYIEQQKVALASLDPQSKSWQDIADKIVKVEEEQEKYVLQLAKAKDLLTPTGGFLGALGGVLSQFNKHVGEAFKQGAGTFEAMGEFSTGMGAQLGVGSNIFKGLLQTGKEAFDKLKGNADSASTAVHSSFTSAASTATQLTASFTSATSAVGTFTAALLNAAGKAASTAASPTTTAPSGEMPVVNPDVTTSGLPGIPEITVPSAQGGTIVAGDTLMQVHEQEMILPAHLSSGLQGIINAFNTAGNPSGQGTAGLSSATNNLIQQFVTLSQATSQASNSMRLVAGQTPGAGLPGEEQQNLLGGVLGPNAGNIPNLTPPPGVGNLPPSVFTNLFSSAKALPGAFSGDDTMQQGTQAVQGFIGALTKATTAVGGFIQSTLGAQTTTGGAISGALSGASLGSAAGPFGALAGAIGGGILGGVMGHKAEQYQDFIQKMEQQFNDLIEEMNTGLLGLSQTLTQLEATRQQVADKSAGKNGKAQKQQTLNQMDQTLQQLQEKQQQVIQAMQKQLDTLQAPTGYQQWLSGLSSIIDQYKQFAEAASNTTQLAQAQQYLTQALQQYAQTQATQVQSAEIDAINNALQLNQLYVQRQQLMEQYAQQEQSILSGGVLTREASASATKAGQMEQLDQQYNQQMDQLNQQIAVSQYKYDTQQKIFNLATTQAGLETQVVQLQESQIDQQNASIAAQENLVNLIRSTPASLLQTMPQIYQALGIPYSGPTAAQVGPQTGILGPTTPAYPVNPQYPVYPTYPTNPTPPQWVYGPGGTITTGPGIPVTTAPQSGTFNPAPGQPGSGNIWTTTPVQGYPGTGQGPTGPSNYTTRNATASPGNQIYTTPGNQLSVAPSAPSQIAYYIQGPTGLLPVYNAPANFQTGPGTGSIVPGGNSAVIPSAIQQTGIGQVYNTQSVPLSNVLGYPGQSLTSEQGVGTTTQTGYSQAVGVIPVTNTEATFNTGTGVVGTGGPPTPSYPIGTTYSPPMMPSALVMYGTDATGNPVYVDTANGDLYDASGKIVGSISASSAPTGVSSAKQVGVVGGTTQPPGVDTSQGDISTVVQRLLKLNPLMAMVGSQNLQNLAENIINQNVVGYVQQKLPSKMDNYAAKILAANPNITQGLTGNATSSTATSSPLPANLTFYGTDQNSNPVYVDSTGVLYNASGQQVGSVQAQAPSSLPLNPLDYLKPGQSTTLAPPLAAPTPASATATPTPVGPAPAPTAPLVPQPTSGPVIKQLPILAGLVLQNASYAILDQNGMLTGGSPGNAGIYAGQKPAYFVQVGSNAPIPVYDPTGYLLRNPSAMPRQIPVPAPTGAGSTPPPTVSTQPTVPPSQQPVGSTPVLTQLPLAAALVLGNASSAILTNTGMLMPGDPNMVADYGAPAYQVQIGSLPPIPVYDPTGWLMTHPQDRPVSAPVAPPAGGGTAPTAPVAPTQPVLPTQPQPIVAPAQPPVSGTFMTAAETTTAVPQSSFKMLAPSTPVPGLPGVSTALSPAPSAGAIAATPMPASLTLYGTDQQGNPIYTDSRGILYNANGGQIGTAQPTAPSGGIQPPPTGGGPYRTEPGTATGGAGAGVPFLPVPNVPVTFNTGPTTQPSNLGPVTGTSGPYILEGSPTPVGMMNQLIGAISTTVKTILPGRPGPVGPEPFRPFPRSGGNPPISGPFSPIFNTPAGSTPTSTLSNQMQTALNNSKLTTETQISSLTSTRIAMESKLLAAKKAQTDYEMQHLNALQQVMSAIGTGNFKGIGAALSLINSAVPSAPQGPGVPTLEQAFYSLHQERGRYGQGGFAGPIP